MKAVKRILCALLALALIAALSACGSFTPRMLIASQKISKLESLHSDTTLQVEAALNLFGEEMPLSLTLELAGDHQKEPNLSAFDARVTVSEYTQHALVYTLKDAEGQQHGYYSTDEGATWTEVEVQSDTADENTQTLNIESSDYIKVALGLADLFEEAGTMILPTGEALVYEGTIPAIYLQELLFSLGAVEKLDQQMPFVVDDSYLNLIGDIQTRIALDKETSMLVRIELDLTQTLDDLVAVLLERYLAEHGLQGTVKLRVDSVTLVTDLSEFDNVSVTLPEGLITEN